MDIQDKAKQPEAGSRNDGTLWFVVLLGLVLAISGCATPQLRGTGDLGLVIERATGSVLVVDTTQRAKLARITGLGDLSHASVVFSRDARYAYVFGRDGGLSKVDILKGELVARSVQAGNAIGGAISQDGRWVAVSNYEPGGVRIFDARTLELVADIPAGYGNGRRSKVIGLVDAPGQRFVFSLYEAGQTWVVEFADPARPVIHKFTGIGRLPYDALLTPDGRWYIAGLFGEDGMALLDLWDLEAGVRRILHDYGRGDEKLPVYKMPHLEGWAVAGDLAFVPAVGRHAVLVVDMNTWEQVDTIPVHGQPVFVMARPDGRQVWVNFAYPDNDRIQVIDTREREIIDTLQPGPGVLHMEFTPRGSEVWVSVRDADALVIYDTESRKERTRLEAEKPSGIFFTDRAHRIGL
ncbi:MAG: protein nirF [Gammaproteobacteria bacterium]|nr:protein nirF [Gammaproteobacteria bacterium]